MASEFFTRLRRDFTEGVLDAEMNDTQTTVTFPEFADLPLSSVGGGYGRFYAVIIEEEVIHITNHHGDGQVTVQRGREGTTAVAHPIGTPWRHGPTMQDFTPTFTEDPEAQTSWYGLNEDSADIVAGLAPYSGRYRSFFAGMYIYVDEYVDVANVTGTTIVGSRAGTYDNCEYSTIVGSNAGADESKRATVIGAQAYTWSGDDLIAIGRYTYAETDDANTHGAIAIGNDAYAYGGATVVGTGARCASPNEKGVAVGHQAEVFAPNAVALGADTEATQANTVAVGDRDIELQGNGRGIILRSPNGSLFKLTVDNNGDLTTDPVT